MKTELKLVKSGPRMLGCNIPRKIVRRFRLRRGDWITVILGEPPKKG
jgi:hypothetical protein